MLSARQLQLLGPQAAVTEAHTPRASAPQQEEPVPPNKRSQCNETPITGE